MRRLWLLAATLALGLVEPLPAQVSLTSFSGNSAKAPTTSAPQTVGLAQMLPRTNPNTALMPMNTGRTFNFTKLLPNFSFMNNRWPLTVGRNAPAPANQNAFGPFKKN